ncbi:hypothetical protein BFJ63_vAg15941 [Fusarium oxysporum f. sp. narcissi]|uniref:Uncharacterized protein n=2 Tax=Fusarium oxysporum TaxID=5507 RepID=A0A4Q2V7Y6_FUSOX|nr:hypothetical protein H9L39_14481 [Fusarium oxysporum f. sp. albedinis]RKK12454.1 hypothetical protein BFJ65_g14312 [Fusarium oxysporum f. sp. cepae]RKK43688.1 hypothetical protein BFJ66_g9892 [Fusarium oxysporum f. sp. cepae]RKK61084.1 hypothetical protein BFJ67_g1800 [Fusarium oxysporum f. sp. cepae]RYC81169.1 hypothetical protein BFJ63_vAg15941 [Fusarium oxysporum f. sp. narcissi]
MTKSAQDEAVEARGFHVVHEPDEADFALLRLKAPFDDRPGQFEKFFHAGSLEFLQQDKAQLDKILEKTCAIVDIYLNRPVVIPELLASAATVMVNYGMSCWALRNHRVNFHSACPHRRKRL